MAKYEGLGDFGLLRPVFRFFYCRDGETHRLIRVLLKQESSQPRGIGAGRKEIGVLEWERERERECDIRRTLERHVGVRAFGSKQTAVCA